MDQYIFSGTKLQAFYIYIYMNNLMIPKLALSS